jgi:hypothetical protein
MWSKILRAAGEAALTCQVNILLLCIHLCTVLAYNVQLSYLSNFCGMRYLGSFPISVRIRLEKYFSFLYNINLQELLHQINKTQVQSIFFLFIFPG